MSKFLVKATFLTIVLILIFKLYTNAQALIYNRKAEPLATYLKAGGAIGNFNLIGVSAGLNIASTRNTYSASYRIMTRLDFNLFGRPHENVWENLSDFSLIYQYDFIKEQLLALNIGSGIMFGKGKFRGQITDSTYQGGFLSSYDYTLDYQNKIYVGIPLQLEFSVKPFRYVAWNIAAYYNIHKHPEYGIMTSTSIGLVRND